MVCKLCILLIFEDQVLENIGRCYLKLDRYVEAKLWLEKANNLNPKNYNASFYKGVTFEKLG